MAAFESHRVLQSSVHSNPKPALTRAPLCARAFSPPPLLPQNRMGAIHEPFSREAIHHESFCHRFGIDYEDRVLSYSRVIFAFLCEGSSQLVALDDF